jgi:hypothetical protein
VIPPYAPPGFQGDLTDPMTGERLYCQKPWWLDYSSSLRSDAVASDPQAEAADAPPQPTPPLPGGWTSAFGYVSAANWPAG